MNHKSLEKRKNIALWIGNYVLRLIVFLGYYFAFQLIIYVYEDQKTPFLIGFVMTIVCYYVYDVLSRLYEGFFIGKHNAIDILIAQLLAIIISDVFVVAMGSAYKRQFVDVKVTILSFVLQVLIVLVWIMIMRHIYQALNHPNRLIAICGAEEDPDVIGKLAFYNKRFQILKVLQEDQIPKILANDLKLDGKACTDVIEGVLINHVNEPKRSHIIEFCQKKGLKVYLVPELSDVTIKSSKFVHLIDTPIFLCESFDPHNPNLLIKRASDIVLSSIALIVLSPLMLLVAICIKLEDHGPVFFLQERCTQGNKTFMILKFRSMYVNCDEIKVLPTMENDPRITKTGRFIRACRIDELPQLINIIKGDMSIVGPRPERLEHVEAYTQMLPEFELRNRMKGGLTGYAQVFGKYNTSPYDKLCMDLIYINNWTLAFDLSIMLQTVKVCLKKESTEAFSTQNAAMIMEATDKIRNGKLNKV